MLRGAAVLSNSDLLRATDVQPFLDKSAGSSVRKSAADASLPDLYYEAVRQGTSSIYDLRRDVERSCLKRALDETGGNITHAAQLLGMTRSRASQLIKEHELLSDGKR